MKKASAIYIFLWFFPFCAFTQKATFQFYTTADGLSNNRIWSCTQDLQGFIWASSDALNRFDGRQFLNYSNQSEAIYEKLSIGRAIHSIGHDIVFIKGQNLLAFNILNGEKKVLPLKAFLSPNAILKPGLSKKISEEAIVIPVIYKERKEADFIKYEHGSLSKMTSLKDVFINFELDAMAVFGSLNNYLFYIDEKLEKVILINANGEKTKELPMPQKGLAQVRPGQHNSILLYQKKKFYVLDKESSTFRPHPINSHFDATKRNVVHSFVQTPEGDLWVSGEDRQLFFFESETGRLFDFHEQLKEAIPYRLELGNITLDQTGVLWISTITGLLKVSPQRKWFDTYFTGQNDECGGQCSFRGFAEDEEGNVYASFYSNVFKINPKNKTTSDPLYPEDHTPFGLHYSEGNLLLNRGWVFDLKKQKTSNPFLLNLDPYDDGKYAFDKEKGLWLAFQGELFFLDKSASPNRWKKIMEVLRKDFIIDIKFDQSGDGLWIATTNELKYYAVENGSIRLVKEKKWEENLSARFIYPDQNGHIWIGTESGLLKYNPKSEEVKMYTTEDGLPNNYVVTILPEGDSCLWLGTHHGLSRFDKATESFINFYEEDGLANNEFNRRSATRTKDGQLFFGGIAGVSAFYPEKVMEKYWAENKAGQLSLVSFSKTNVEKDTTFTTIFNGENPEVEIHYQNKTFHFEFALTDYHNIENVKYSYQMEGYDNVWSKPSIDNTASFNYLPAGKYTFRVKALTTRGQWHGQQLSVKVDIHPPWWATWWAYSLYLLVIGGITYTVFYFLKKRWELQNNLQLEQAEARRLKELDAFKSRLYTNLTHEFRTPLTVILGMTRQILASPKNGVEKAAQLIENNGHNLLRLVNQLLDLSKLEDKSFKLNLQQSDIVPYLQYVTESFQSYANGQNLSLRFFTTLKDLEMDFDPEQLKQVLTNLISNAIKFTPSGGEVKIEIGKLTDPKEEIEKLEIIVSDTGIGISSKNLPHIFDRFYQVDGTTTRAGEGTGIGLAHTLELVKLMDGKITVESELGKGSVFRLNLPIKNNVEVATIIHEPNIRNSFPVSNSSPSLIAKGATQNSILNTQNFPTLLIIEDNPDVVFYLKTCLTDQYQMEVAYNGRIGVEKAVEEIPDLIISDVMMPEKDGYEVCDILKNDERTSHIPIILLTAKADAASKIAGLKRGADAYLSKPFDKEELLVRLEKLVELRKNLQERYGGGQMSDTSKVSDTYVLEDAFVQKVMKIVEENYSNEDFALPQLCQKIGMSRSQLFRKMKALMDISPSEFIRNYRMEKAKSLLEMGEWTVSEVAYKVGFKHLPHFSKNFQDTFGYPPSTTSK